jgi:hypothetical protein
VTKDVDSLGAINSARSNGIVAVARICPCTTRQLQHEILWCYRLRCIIVGDDAGYIADSGEQPGLSPPVPVKFCRRLGRMAPLHMARPPLSD